MPAETVAAWLSALEQRHLATLTGAESARAVRALSARYVERRDALSNRSPVDTAGKRAAFAAFYAPLHFLTLRDIIDALGADRLRLERLVDLGCGTGVGGAAWASRCLHAPTLEGIDRSGWALEEARWNWRRLQLTGRTHRADAAAWLERSASPSRARFDRTAFVLAWSLNEFTSTARDRTMARLTRAVDRGVTVLVCEPLAGRAVPWWASWASAIERLGGRADTWSFPAPLPEPLARLDRDAGFHRDALTARTLFLSPQA